MIGINSALSHCLLRSPRAAGRHFSVDQRVIEQVLRRTRDAVAVKRVGVLVASNYE